AVGTERPHGRGGSADLAASPHAPPGARYAGDGAARTAARPSRTGRRLRPHIGWGARSGAVRRDRPRRGRDGRRPRAHLHPPGGAGERARRPGQLERRRPALRPAMIIAGKYEVLGKLGQGGQGSVYKVRHLGLDEVRALKVQPDHGTGEETVARFRREGRALARLRHAHIVQVFDLGRDADQYYLEMEYVDGPNLAQYLKANGRPPVLDALEIARQVADALTYAHVQPYVDSAGVQHTGMVHRDIKPSNILLRDRTPMYALPPAFGLVKLGDPGERTTTGTMLGTYKYSAPEQLGLKRGRERVPVDFRADVFAFGLVLFELLEGRQFHAGLET